MTLRAFLRRCWNPLRTSNCSNSGNPPSLAWLLLFQLMSSVPCSPIIPCWSLLHCLLSLFADPVSCFVGLPKASVLQPPDYSVALCWTSAYSVFPVLISQKQSDRYSSTVVLFDLKLVFLLLMQLSVMLTFLRGHASESSACCPPRFLGFISRASSQPVVS